MRSPTPNRINVNEGFSCIIAFRVSFPLSPLYRWRPQQRAMAAPKMSMFLRLL